MACTIIVHRLIEDGPMIDLSQESKIKVVPALYPLSKMLIGAIVPRLRL